MTRKITHTPTNLVMGFLGVGKTTAILDLLKQKPAGENWAVLVNEFGKIGMDGAFFEAHGVTVKEISGGCLCCAVGIPFQVAVNRLLTEIRPDRLLIEPTGLGHPKRVIEMLTEGYFQTSIELRAAICLVDPRKLKESRYTSHESFIDQIALADVLVANKIELADPKSIELFENQVRKSTPPKAVSAQISQGKLAIHWLDLPHNPLRKPIFKNAHANNENSAEVMLNYQSFSHSFSEESLFDYLKIVSLLCELGVERIKALLHTDKGWFIFNIAGGESTITPCKPIEGSKVEIIGAKLNSTTLLKALSHCLIAKP